ARLRPLAARWRHEPNFSTDGLARMIRADGVDIALELAGLTTRQSLGALTMRPAPVQGTYLGYPNTTGVPAIDFRIVDSITDPPGAEAWATERIVRLDPCFLCFRASDDAPEPRMPPPGNIVFGSFNVLSKLNDPLIRLWTRVLNTVPGSR